MLNQLSADELTRLKKLGAGLKTIQVFRALIKPRKIFPPVAAPNKVTIINDQTGVGPLKVDTVMLLANQSDYAEDFREVRGQTHAKRAKAAGIRQNDAGQTHADNTAAARI